MAIARFLLHYLSQKNKLSSLEMDQHQLYEFTCSLQVRGVNIVMMIQSLGDSSASHKGKAIIEGLLQSIESTTFGFNYLNKWAQEHSSAQFRSELSVLIKPESGFHSNASNLAVAQLGEYTVEKMAMKYEGLCPSLWGLVMMLLNIKGVSCRRVGEDTIKKDVAVGMQPSEVGAMEVVVEDRGEGGSVVPV